MIRHSEKLPSALLPLANDAIDTPAIVYDLTRLEELLTCAQFARDQLGFKLLYSIKAAACSQILQGFGPQLDGFAASSLFEAQLARDLGLNAPIHLTSPGIRPSEIPRLGRLCQFIAFNSPTQYERFCWGLTEFASLGLRVNTRISYTADERYDPCGPFSKLGTPIELVPSTFAPENGLLRGIHLHTNADSTDFGELLANLRGLAEWVPEHLELDWLNLGGGYLFEESSIDPLEECVNFARDRFGAEVYLEPGASLVRAAGFLLTRVLDVFEVDGLQIAVLDTTVNHMPEVLEFGYQPAVVGSKKDGTYEYALVGSTCLAGDVFGRYRFNAQLEVGSLMTISDAGAYTLSKAHRFNGINLPSVGAVNRDGQFAIWRKFDYSEYRSYWIADG